MRRSQPTSKVMRNVLLSFALIALAFISQPARAYDSDEALENYGHLCTRQVVRNEREYGIPNRLLRAIATTETGRWHSGLKMSVPWPWVINVEGKPYFFHSKNEAVAATAAFQAKGIKSIDVGCMQVNLRHHPDAFANLNQAFEPKFNVEYAARLLRSHYDASDSWQTAVGRYHSFTPKYANPYISRVYSKWHGFSGKTTQVASVNDPHRVTAASSQARAVKPQSKKQYNTFVQVGNQEAKYFTRTKDNPGELVNHIRTPSSAPAKVEDRTNRYQLALIKPTIAANEVETAPTQDSSETGPLIITDASADKKSGKGFSIQVTSPDSVSRPLPDTDSLFIRYSN